MTQLSAIMDFISLLVIYLIKSVQAVEEMSGDWDPATTPANLAKSKILQATTTYMLDTADGTTAFIPLTAEYGSDFTTRERNVSLDDASMPNVRNEEMDIVPIVGAVCGVAGVLLGIMISAGAWYYATKRRMRSHAPAIPKNPEEKTFERLDFNLTLPRNQPSDSPSSVHSSLPDGGYLHFEEPTPHPMDGSAVGPQDGTPPSVHNSQGSIGFNGYQDESEEGPFRYQMPGDDFFIEDDSQHRISMPQRSVYYKGTVPYGELLQKDFSDQSIVSKRSSSMTGVERTSSICTCRTDLPESDCSNCSTCGASVSVTSSLARERVPGIQQCRRDHHNLQEYTTSRTLPHVPSNRVRYSDAPTLQPFQETSVINDESDSQQNPEMLSLSSSDSFLNEHENGWYDNATAEETCGIEDTLKYFDLKLPPSTFSSPRKSEYHENEEEYQQEGLHRNNSETTINL